MPKRIALIDLDGVLNNYRGDYNKNKIPAIRKGAKEFLEKISEDYVIEIFTVRDKELTRSWLEENGLSIFVSDITRVKNAFASLIVDDRAIRFEGDFEKTLNDVKNFKPFWEK